MLWGNSSTACNNLGTAYYKGRGVTQDYQRAKELLKKACNSGLALGCQNYKMLNMQYKSLTVVDDKLLQDMVKELKSKETEKQKKELNQGVENNKSPKIKQEYTTAIQGIYIQVGATSRKTISPKIVKKINEAGFNLATSTISIKGTTIMKIFIGPFIDKNGARSFLPKIQKEINKDAFIYKVK